MQKRSKGFTLLELMIVLVIAGITLTAAFPSFQGMLARNRIATQTNDLLLAINLARSEALRVGGTVSVQAVDSSDGTNEFGPGWCVVIGNPGNCANAIRVFQALEGNTTLNSVENVASMQFNSLGGLSGAASTTRSFDLCHPAQDGRRVVVSLIGRSKSHKPLPADVEEGDPEFGQPEPSC